MVVSVVITYVAVHGSGGAVTRLLSRDESIADHRALRFVLPAREAARMRLAQLASVSAGEPAAYRMSRVSRRAAAAAGQSVNIQHSRVASTTFVP